MIFTLEPKLGCFLLVPPTEGSPGQIVEQHESIGWRLGADKFYDIETGEFEVDCEISVDVGRTGNGFRCGVRPQWIVSFNLEKSKNNEAVAAEALTFLMRKINAPTRRQRQKVERAFTAQKLGEGLRGIVRAILNDWHYPVDPSKLPGATNELNRRIRVKAEELFSCGGAVSLTFFPTEPSLPAEHTDADLANPQVFEVWKFLQTRKGKKEEFVDKSKVEKDLRDDEIKLEGKFPERAIAVGSRQHRMELAGKLAKEAIDNENAAKRLEAAKTRCARELEIIAIEKRIDAAPERATQQVEHELAVAKLENVGLRLDQEAIIEAKRAALVAAQKNNALAEVEIALAKEKGRADAITHGELARIAGQKEILLILLQHLPEILKAFPPNAIANPTALHVLQIGTEGVGSNAVPGSSRLPDLLGTVPPLILLRELFKFLGIGQSKGTFDTFGGEPDSDKGTWHS